MEQNSVKLSSNWSHIGGCSFSKCVTEVAADPDVFIKPNINKLVDEEKSILLGKAQSLEYCEVYINKFPQYKIQAVSLACNVVKVEIFQGLIKEYVETVYGVVLEETDDQFNTYRYDVEIEKSGITDLTLRFLTSSSEVCLFGIMLHISPNPNGITSLLPFKCCLNSQQDDFQPELKTSSECEKPEKLFEQVTTSSPQYSFSMKENVKQKLNDECDEICGNTSGKTSEDVLKRLKSYIDERLNDIEKSINENLAAMEQRQNKKMDKLLSILENK